MANQPLILGIGNALRGDDNAGLCIAKEVGRRLGDAVCVSCDPARLWDALLGDDAAELVVIIDAAEPQDSLPPGALRRLSLNGWNDVRPEGQSERQPMGQSEGRPGGQTEGQPGGQSEERSPAEAALPLARLRDTHSVNLDLLLRLAQKIGRVDVPVWIYAVGAKQFSLGADLSPAVANAVSFIAGQIEAEVRDWLANRLSGKPGRSDAGVKGKPGASAAAEEDQENF